ncbi:MAG: hypothetical protein EPO40_18765 [Myxococcaceae bacterium]|nr:MAG: hypothetical protein EPO40_18765 [Myxococcaceae bacterium]
MDCQNTFDQWRNELRTHRSCSHRSRGRLRSHRLHCHCSPQSSTRI